MENYGLNIYQEDGLMLDMHGIESPDDMIYTSNLVAHETAHQVSLFF
jgi:aminopeptidase N